MGASLPGLAAIEVAGNPHGTWSHPPKHAPPLRSSKGGERLSGFVPALWQHRSHSVMIFGSSCASWVTAAPIMWTAWSLVRFNTQASRSLSVPSPEDLESRWRVPTELGRPVLLRGPQQRPGGAANMACRPSLVAWKRTHGLDQSHATRGHHGQLLTTGAGTIVT